MFEKYDAYKSTDIKSIGYIPDSWNIFKLKNVLKAKITDGPHETPVFIEEGIPFLSVDAIQDGDLVFEGCRYVSPEKHQKYSLKCKVEKNDILMGKAASTGKIARIKVDFPFSIWSPLALIKIDTRKAYPEFIEFVLKSRASQIQIDDLCTLNTQKNISMGDIPKINLALPSLQTQREIISFLTTSICVLDQAITIKEQQIALLNERKQIVIQKAVTQGLDPNVPMKDSGVEWIGQIPEHWEVIRSKFLFTQRKENSKKDDVQLSATQAYGVIPQEEYEKRTGKSVVKISLHLDKRKRVHLNDFVISMRSFQGGLERAWAEGCIRSSYVVLKPLKPIDPDYYGYLFKTPMYIKALQNTSNFIRDGQDLNFGNFSQVDLFIVPLSEQKQIVEYIKSQLGDFEKHLELLNQQIEKLKEYKTTLINDAVTGKIKVA